MDRLIDTVNILTEHNLHIFKEKKSENWLIRGCRTAIIWGSTVKYCISYLMLHSKIFEKWEFKSTLLKLKCADFKKNMCEN